MSRIIIVGVVMTAAGLTTLNFLDDPRERAPISNDVNEFDSGTTKLMVNYRHFKDTLDSTLVDLEARDVNLNDATARVYAAANRYCPSYLTRVGESDPAVTLEASVAKNLVGHIRSLEEVRPAVAVRVAELENEFENLVNQLDD